MLFRDWMVMIMRITDFSTHLTAFLADFLPKQRNFSSNTVASYCDAFKLFLRFCAQHKNLQPEKLRLKDLTASLVLDYLRWLEEERHCAISTRNQRLAAIHSFITYVSTEAPENLLEFVKIQKIPFKETAERVMDYLSVDDMTLILRQPNIKTPKGRQHLTILSLLYDSAGRAQEIADLSVRDIPLLKTKVIVTGKGRKVRELPLTSNTLSLLQAHIKEHRLNMPEKQDNPLFSNHQKGKFTRAGIAYVLEKYVSEARQFTKTIPKRVTPHIIRHTKAMHLLQAGIPLHIIQDILGHKDISTTQRYARANLDMKREALESTQIHLDTEDEFDYLEEQDVLEWLSDYAKACTE